MGKTKPDLTEPEGSRSRRDRRERGKAGAGGKEEGRSRRERSGRGKEGLFLSPSPLTLRSLRLRLRLSLFAPYGSGLNLSIDRRGLAILSFKGKKQGKKEAIEGVAIEGPANPRKCHVGFTL